MRTLPVFTLLLCFACTPVRNVPTAPTPEQIATAKYGPEPEQAQLASIVRKYLKKRGYYDPNGTEIEECVPAKKGWIAIDAWETDNEGFTSPSKDFYFGWKTKCDINGKNRMGGFVGFETIEYILVDNMVKAGNLPRSSRDNTFTAGGLGGPLWGNR